MSKMLVLSKLNDLVTVLETYRGRDRAIRLTTYVAMFMSGTGDTRTQMKWKTVATQMGACRVILRLFDDLPMFLFNLSTGFGLKEKGALKPFSVLTSVLNQLFYPTEHIAWLRDKEILKGMALPFQLLGLLIWAVTLILEIIKSLLKLQMLSTQAKKLVKQRELDRDGSGQDSQQNVQIKENLKKLDAERKDTILLLIQYSSDLTNAISWMPPGILWSQKLKPSTNGVFGMIATFIMFYRNWPSKQT